MKGKFVSHRQFNVFHLLLVSVINMEHELVQLANCIHWIQSTGSFPFITLTCVQ
jgi:hypothetical protein